MQDTELYRQILGLESPWRVTRVDLIVKEQRVDVHTEHAKRKTWPCPECGEDCGLHDHDEERVWRHLDSCQFQTFLHARIPRIRCKDHGVRQVRVSWAEPKSRFTLLFERLAIEVLQHTDVKGAAAILGISWDEAHGIMERAVARGLRRREHRVPTRLGIDEKSLAKGHRYASIVTDLDGPAGPCVLDLAEGRTKEALVRCLGRYSIDELQRVEVVAMDMSGPYISAVQWLIGGEKIVFDRFHIMMHMNDAVDRVRRGENRALRSDGDDRLVGSKHAWLYARENLPERYQESFAELRRANLKTGRAWAIKESLRDLWNQPTLEDATDWHRRWRAWATRCQLEPVRKVAAMIQRHLPNILSYFAHPVTNAAAESINSVIQMIKKRSFGFRSFHNFRVAVLFRCGGLDLFPRPLSHMNA